MRHTDGNRIEELVRNASGADSGKISLVVRKSLALKGLSLEEAAVLLSADSPEDIALITEAASGVKEKIYGKRVVIFAPLYLNNICSNDCLYCAFRSGNVSIKRKKLTPDEVAEETTRLLRTGHKRLLLVSSEAEEDDTDYLVDSIRTVYAQKLGPANIRRVNINCAPLSDEGFKKIKAEGIGTYQLFQETYHEATYRKVHPSGPKSDPESRMDAIDRAFRSGIDDVGIGVLFGLYDYRFEILALLSHVEYLEKTFGVGPHTISVPRIEPARGADLTYNVPYALSDDAFRKVVSVLRLAVPYTGIILSTRETPEMRDELFTLGVSQISAGSSTSPGGYGSGESASGAQFALNDHRSLEEIMERLIKDKAVPSFCTACYRKERTGCAFMDLARPGTIKDKCQINALITLKEYLDDFAPPELKKRGYELIEHAKRNLSEKERSEIAAVFGRMDSGEKDEYI